ncbi:hypothetical protein SmJEL517_g02683 [Synchytrium microbalum]|uniref:Endonuclease/exonuclease/phosphatase domain-containing protein n=1 Tax=Synchytrium microbalum TaxID=1806994 RepID=A0A507C5J6_9FUNG|nr:uncharacterized protein SmJEL517_g02683 [Synchytrium microbalum]TPX34648.1 hypothetical protein SmJEL517_g02683 [Synchytrium microbalum]
MYLDMHANRQTSRNGVMANEWIKWVFNLLSKIWTRLGHNQKEISNKTYEESKPIQATSVTSEMKHASLLGSFNIVSYNIRYGNANDGGNSWEFRRDAFYRNIQKLNPDILCLQELVEFQKHELLAGVRALGIEYDCVGRARGHHPDEGEYSPIMYKPSVFELVSSGTFWYSDTPDTPGGNTWDSGLPRICTWAVLNLKAEPSAPPVIVYNSHFDLSVISRKRSFPLLLSKIAANGHDTEPCLIITGDFNINSDDEFTPLEKAGFKDSYAIKHPSATAAERSTFHYFTGKPNPNQPKIDCIFFKPKHSGLVIDDADIDRYHEDNRFPSDHFAVWTHFEIKM